MATFIHPTSLVSPEATLGEGCYVGPFCTIGPGVTLGRNNRLEAYVSLGLPAEHREYFRKDAGPVAIGDHNVFREFVTINGGTTGVTTIGSNCSLLRGSHIGHDAIVRDGANLSCNVMIGGHAIIGQGANLGLSSTVHQHRVLGAFVMVGMNSAVTRHLPPFLIAFGAPARVQRINRVGLSRAGVGDPELARFEAWFQEFEGRGRMTNLEHPFAAYLRQFDQDRRSLEPGSVTPTAA